MTELVTFNPHLLLDKDKLTKQDEKQLEDYMNIVAQEAKALRNGPVAVTQNIIITEDISYRHLSLKVACMDRKKGSVVEAYVSQETAKKLLDYLQQFLQAAELEKQANRIYNRLYPYGGW